MVVNFRNTMFAKLAATLEQCPNDDMPEIVLSGKSNVGKSSLVNGLSDNKKLARVSQTPGKTQAVIYFNVDKKFYIADLPGYGYARTSKEKIEKFSKLANDYFISGRKFNLVLHLMDIRHEPSKHDIGMLEYMNEANIPYFVVFTKCDKFSKQQLRNRLNELSRELEFNDDAQIFAVSSEKKIGLEDLKNAITEFLFEQG